MLRKLVGWLILAFLLYYVVHDPEAAAVTAKAVGTGVEGAAMSLRDFFAMLAQSH